MVAKYLNIIHLTRLWNLAATSSLVPQNIWKTLNSIQKWSIRWLDFIAIFLGVKWNCCPCYTIISMDNVLRNYSHICTAKYIPNTWRTFIHSSHMRTGNFCELFMSSTVRLWNIWAVSVFPPSYNLPFRHRFTSLFLKKTLDTASPKMTRNNLFINLVMLTTTSFKTTYFVTTISHTTVIQSKEKWDTNVVCLSLLTDRENI